MAELVDAPASGAGTGNGVEVRVLFWAPNARTTVVLCNPRLSKEPAKAGFLRVFAGNQAFCAKIGSSAVQCRLLASKQFVGIFVGILQNTNT